MNLSKPTLISCFHCGNKVPDSIELSGEKAFCCNGCKMVYEILNENDLCTYYELNEAPGIIQDKSKRADKFAFLEDEAIQKKLISYSDKNQQQVTFYLPQIHCK